MVLMIASLTACRSHDPYTFQRHCIDSGIDRIEVFTGEHGDGSSSSIHVYVRAPLNHGSDRYQWIPGAIVNIDSIQLATDQRGMFEYTGIASGSYVIEIRFIGTEVEKTRIDIAEGERVVVLASLCLAGGFWSSAP